MSETPQTPLTEKVRTNAVELLMLVDRYRAFVGAVDLYPVARVMANELDAEARQLIALCTGVTDGPANDQASLYSTTFSDTPRG